ncbi:hypothetical protein NC651_040199 [Populus alba x Populus x berolinensis]|nr:hypothetical protein NC651_040199 [Populus alba x Populus x berolinensis]
MAVSQEVMKLGRSFSDQAGAPGAGPVPGSSAPSSRSTGKWDDGNVIDAEFSCIFSCSTIQYLYYISIPYQIIKRGAPCYEAACINFLRAPYNFQLVYLLPLYFSIKLGNTLQVRQEIGDCLTF